MMYCGYHAKNPAVVQCNQCARWLCPACDHRVRGFPFCQDCIVQGVELLRHHSSSHPANILKRKSSPFVAALLSFVPGLGAAYNGQTSKAIVHFAIFASFFQMAVVTQVALVALGAYMLFDYIRRGKASDRIVRFDSRRPPPSVVPNARPADTANFRTGETTQFARRDVTPLPFERRS
jgi:hypothetical protein